MTADDRSWTNQTARFLAANRTSIVSGLVGLLLGLFMHSMWGGAEQSRQQARTDALIALHSPKCPTPKLSTDLSLPEWSDDAGIKALGLFGADVAAVAAGTKAPTCKLKNFGKSWGAHMLCDRRPAAPCFFFSFGVSTEYSFDVMFSKTYGCVGYALDPTVEPGAKLSTDVVFLYAGAKALEETTNNRWLITTSVPALRNWLGVETLAVLKMDCEGCEFSLARDILLEEPHLLQRVDMFAVEVHLSKWWMTTRQHAVGLGHLYTLLTRAGLELQHVAVTRCTRTHEEPGCADEVLAAGFPCHSRGMCHNYLFARPDPQKPRGLRVP